MKENDWYAEALDSDWETYNSQLHDRQTIRQRVGALFRRVPLASDFMFLRDLRSNSYLAHSGWFESVHRKMPVDAGGNPMPWITYAAIEFLSPRICAEWSVFEFGCGNSTLWWSSRIARIVSCEHNAMWVNGFKTQCPQNVHLIHHPETPDGPYARATQEFIGVFHVIVIDGSDRVNCARHCLKSLRPDGVVLWDNTERSEYMEGFAFLESNGFRRIDFSGLGPANRHGWSTSVFYRPANCLRI